MPFNPSKDKNVFESTKFNSVGILHLKGIENQLIAIIGF
jgi:hypothetical protein